MPCVHARTTQCLRRKTFEPQAYRVWSNLCTWDPPFAVHHPLSDGHLRLTCLTASPLLVMVEQRTPFSRAHELIGDYVSLHARKTRDPCEFVWLVAESPHVASLRPLVTRFDADPHRATEALSMLDDLIARRAEKSEGEASES